MKNRYDMVVVGAGPGGSVTARRAAEKGLDVLLIEKRQEIGTPVRCAEGLSKMGLGDHLEPDRRWIAAEPGSGRIHSPDGTQVIMSEKAAGNEVGYVLDRKIFDRALAYKAADAGAEVYTKTAAKGLITNDGFVKGVIMRHFGDLCEVSSDIVIGADGVESLVGRWAGIDTALKASDMEAGAQYLMSGIDVDQEFCEFYLGNNLAPGGYAWFFPKGERQANVGVGVLSSMTDQPAVKYLDNFVKRKFPEGHILETVYGGIPVLGQIERSVANGLILVGDAARHTDPITGGGIANAMNAGVAAVGVAVKAISIGDTSTKTLDEYERKWRSSAFGIALKNRVAIKKKFIKFRDSQLDNLAHSLKDVVIGEMTISGLMAELIKQNPKALLDLRKVVF